ncbi:hypothetical protein BGX21_010953 [Mortierella sp. AD011]|nr:hypothetical protein BGX20_009957 [Mortierella sp. AD010]KAF9392687.1 hypothetical protein BGX21_010953 [Mortierella sp. AD011]
MVTHKKTNPPFSSSVSGISGGTDLSEVSPAYYQELQDTFQLFDTEHKGVLSIKKLRLAMRTLGFEASIDDIQEIIQEMPELSVHMTKMKKQQGRKAKNKGKESGSSTLDKESTGSRRSSRVAAAASRTSSKPKYADSDVEVSSGDDDAYEDEETGVDMDDERDDTELYFTMEDFITIMTPSEDQHGQDEISRVFQLFDTQGKGSIRLEDLRRVAAELGIPMKDEELREMIEEADRDGDGAVTEQEFGKIVKKTGF